MRVNTSSQGPTQRQLRVAGLLRQLIGNLLLRRELRSPIVNEAAVVITEVRIGADLQTAVVFFTCRSGGDIKLITKALRESAKEIRHLIAPELHLKFIPQLKFNYDDSFDKAHKIETLLNQIAAQPSGGTEAERDN